MSFSATAGFSPSQQAYSSSFGTTPTKGVVLFKRDPTSNDLRYSQGQIWINTLDANIWYLNTFSSSNGAVTANWIQFDTGVSDISSLILDAGTTTIVPDASGQVTMTGAQIENASLANVIQTNGTAASTMTIQIQRSGSDTDPNTALNGVCHFDSDHFTVDTDGFVQLAGGGSAIDSFTVPLPTPGTVVSPSGTGNIDWPVGNGITMTGGTNAVTANMVSPFTGSFEFTQTVAGTSEVVTVSHTDNTAAAVSNASLSLSVGGDTQVGDAYVQFATGSSRVYAFGSDTSDSQTLKITTNAAANTSPSAGTELLTLTSAGVLSLPPLNLSCTANTITSTSDDNMVLELTPTNATGNQENAYTLNGGLLTHSYQASAPITADGDYYIVGTVGSGNRINGIFTLYYGDSNDRSDSLVFSASLATDGTGIANISMLSRYCALDNPVFSAITPVIDSTTSTAYLRVTIGSRNGSEEPIRISAITSEPVELFPATPASPTTITRVGIDIDPSGITDIIGILGVNSAYYLPATDGTANQVLTTNGSSTVSWATVSGAGKVLQQVVATRNTSLVLTQASTAATIPIDNTIPQQTEGLEFLTVAITPTSASNYLLVSIETYVSAGIGNSALISALFQDSTADAFAATINSSSGQPSAYRSTVSYSVRITAGTTSSTTIKWRVGKSGTGAQSETVNGTGGGGLFGGVSIASLTVSEIEA